MEARFEVLVGRIERMALDAVVNAANTGLLPGTGVDGALRAAAGPDLTKATARLGPIAVGEAVLTRGFALPARFVIHTAAPVFSAHDDLTNLSAGLARCYASSLALAAAHDLRSIAFPCLGTGNFGWPRDLACDTALAACQRALATPPCVARIVFCCFSETDAAPYRARLGG